MLNGELRQPSKNVLVIVHRWTGLSNDLLIEVDGIRCTNVATTLCQLGMVVGLSRVEQALDSALRDGVSPLWIAQVARALDRPGPSGVAMLRRLLNDPSRRGALPDSWFERLLSKRLRQGVLPEPVIYVTWSMAGNLDNFLGHITAVYQTRLQQVAA